MSKTTTLHVHHAPGEGYFRTFGWGCAAGTLEPLAYTRASSRGPLNALLRLGTFIEFLKLADCAEN